MGQALSSLLVWKAKWPLREMVWQVFTQLNQLLPYDSAIMLFGIYPCELKLMFTHTQACIYDYRSFFIYNCQNLKVTRMFFNR